MNVMELLEKCRDNGVESLDIYHEDVDSEYPTMCDPKPEMFTEAGLSEWADVLGATVLLVKDVQSNDTFGLWTKAIVSGCLSSRLSRMLYDLAGYCGESRWNANFRET